MKKIIISLGFVGLFAIGFFLITGCNNGTTNTNDITAVDAGCKHGQCEATAKSTGLQCRHCVSNAGDLYCWQH